MQDKCFATWIKFVNAVLEAKCVEVKPVWLIGDKAYDSDPLDKNLKAKSIELIVPHKINRVKPPTGMGGCLDAIGNVGRLSDWFLGCKTIDA